MSNNTNIKDAVVIERTFDAPVDLIWQMWTQPEHFKKWYGPKGATVPVAEMDVRVGGKRLVCMEMQTPDGSMKMWTAGEHTEVVPNNRLVYTESMSDEQGNIVAMSGDKHSSVTEVTILLEVLGDHTKMVLTHAGIPADSPGASGWNQAFDKLADHIDMTLKG